MGKEWLLCDFHIHTDMSDGKLPLREVVDLYGRNGFDVISITDHLYEKYTVDLWLNNNERPCTVRKQKFPEYLGQIKQEGERARKKYGMLVIPGAEISNNEKLFHILALDIKEYIDPDRTVEEITTEIHAQKALAIACHPHYRSSEQMQFLHLWDNHEKYAGLFDAWEVANRDDLFGVIGLKKFNYIAGSDFHGAGQIFSWKSLVRSDKTVKDVKAAIRRKGEVSIYLFRKECAPFKK